MKFLKLVPWARTSAQLDPAVTTARTSPVGPVMACTESAVPVHTESMAVWSDMTEKKRRRSSGHGKTWRPSLDAISENATLRATPAMAAGKEREGKSRGKKAKAKARVTIYRGCDDLRLVSNFFLPFFLLNLNLVFFLKV